MAKKKKKRVAAKPKKRAAVKRSGKRKAAVRKNRGRKPVAKCNPPKMRPAKASGWIKADAVRFVKKGGRMTVLKVECKGFSV